MPGMTTKELDEHVRNIVLPLIKDSVGPLCAEIVKEMVSDSISRPPIEEPATKIMNPLTEMEKGLPFGKCVRAMAFAKMNGGGYTDAISALKDWGDGALAEYLVDARTKAQAAGEPTAGGFLVPEQFSQDVIELLRPQSVIRGLNPATLPMPTGTVRIPKISTGTAATYIGENTNISKTQLALGQITLTWKKLAALVPISNDLLRYSSPGADAIVRDDMVRAIAQRENQAFLRDDGTGGGPKGLRHWAAAGNIIAATTGEALADITTDLGRCILKLKENNIPMTRTAWIMSPRTEHKLATIQNSNGFFVYRDEILQKRLWGMPIAVTTEVPNNLTDQGGTVETELYLVDFADAIIGEAMRLIVDSSGEAAYHDGASVVSAWSQDQTVIRAIAEHDFAMRREESVVVMNGITWGS